MATHHTSPLVWGGKLDSVWILRWCAFSSVWVERSGWLESWHGWTQRWTKEQSGLVNVPPCLVVRHLGSEGRENIIESNVGKSRAKEDRESDKMSLTGVSTTLSTVVCLSGLSICQSVYPLMSVGFSACLYARLPACDSLVAIAIQNIHVFIHTICMAICWPVVPLIHWSISPSICSSV